MIVLVIFISMAGGASCPLVYVHRHTLARHIRRAGVVTLESFARLNPWYLAWDSWDTSRIGQAVETFMSVPPCNYCQGAHAQSECPALWAHFQAVQTHHDYRGRDWPGGM